MTTPDRNSDIFSMLQAKPGQARVVEATVKQVEKVKAGSSTVAKSLQEMIAESEQKLDEVISRGKLTEEDIQSLQAGIILADLESARTSREEMRVDLGQAMVGLNESLAIIGENTYVQFGEETEEEKIIVSSAKERLQKADARQRAAEAQVAVAGTKMKLFGIRKRAVDSAQKELSEANIELESAKAGVPAAEQRAKQIARERLQNSTIDDSLEAYTKMASDVEQVMIQRREDSLAEEEFVRARRETADQIKVEATEKLKTAEAEVSELETRVQTLKDELELLQSGTTEFARKELEIRNTSSELEEAQNRRNVALVVSDSKTRYVEELALHEKSLQKLRGNLESWIAALHSAAEERVATFRAVLQQQKMLDDQEVASQLDEVGAETDRRNLEFAAKAVVATDKARAEMMNSLPERMKAVRSVAAGLSAHLKETLEKDKEFLKSFHDKYGLGNSEI